MHTMVEIEAAFSQLPGGRLLDVATGGGSFAGWLADLLLDVGEIVGIDSRAEPLAVDDSIFDRAHANYIQMDAHMLDFDDASFDTVAIAYALHHMTDPAAVLTEMRRVLKPGGYLIIREMHQDDLTEEQRTHMLVHHWWAAIDRAEGIMHNETYTRQGLHDLIAGCTLQEVITFEYADLETDAFDDALLAHLRERITRATERAQHLPDGGALIAQADDLAHRVESVGFRSATVIVAAGRK